MFQWAIELSWRLGYLGNRVIWAISLFGKWGCLYGPLFQQLFIRHLVRPAYLRFSAWVGNFGEVIFHVSQATLNLGNRLFGKFGYLGNRVIWTITIFRQCSWLNDWLSRQLVNRELVSLASMRFSALLGTFGDVIFHISQAMFYPQGSCVGFYLLQHKHTPQNFRFTQTHTTQHMRKSLNFVTVFRKFWLPKISISFDLDAFFGICSVV